VPSDTRHGDILGWTERPEACSQEQPRWAVLAGEEISGYHGVFSAIEMSSHVSFFSFSLCTTVSWILRTLSAELFTDRTLFLSLFTGHPLVLPGDSGVTREFVSRRHLSSGQRSAVIRPVTDSSMPTSGLCRSRQPGNHYRTKPAVSLRSVAKESFSPFHSRKRQSYSSVNRTQDYASQATFRIFQSRCWAEVGFPCGRCASAAPLP